MLDLFITHYNEPWDIGRKGFQMLACQRHVDWSEINITLVHDGTPVFPSECFANFPFTVKQVVLPHGGIAKVRNWCIENSTAKWIKWNDFDDTFFGMYSLYSIMNVLGSNAFDLLWYDLMWDERDMETYNGSGIHIRTERNPVFIHDKVFRRDFLVSHNIRFNEELIWCEDSAFLALIEMEIDTNRIGKIKCNYPIYTYICRKGSLCNRPEIKFENLKSFFKRHCYVADEFLKHNLIEQYNTMCVRVMADGHYTLCKVPGITADKSEHEANVWAWYEAHKEPFSKCTPEMFDMVIDAVNKECWEGGSITKDDVIKWINTHERGE